MDFIKEHLWKMLTASWQNNLMVLFVPYNIQRGRLAAFQTCTDRRTEVIWSEVFVSWLPLLHTYPEAEGPTGDTREILQPYWPNRTQLDYPKIMKEWGVTKHKNRKKIIRSNFSVYKGSSKGLCTLFFFLLHYIIKVRKHFEDPSLIIVSFLHCYLIFFGGGGSARILQKSEVFSKIYSLKKTKSRRLGGEKK